MAVHSWRSCQRRTYLGDDLAGSFGEVVPGEPEHGPASQHNGVLPLTITAEHLHAVMPSPTIDLNRHPSLRKGQVKLVPTNHEMLLPTAETSRPRQAYRRPLGCRGGPIGSSQQPTRGGRATPAEVSAVRPMQGVEAHPPLQSAIHELGSKLNRRLQHGQRHRGDPQTSHANAVDVSQVATHDPHPGPRARTAAGRHRDVHNGRRVEAQPVPPRRSVTRDSRCLTSPQRYRPNTSLAGGPVDPWMNHHPPPSPKTLPNLTGAHTRGERLIPTDDPGPQPENPLDKHGPVSRLAPTVSPGLAVAPVAGEGARQVERGGHREDVGVVVFVLGSHDSLGCQGERLALPQFPAARRVQPRGILR